MLHKSFPSQQSTIEIHSLPIGPAKGCSSCKKYRMALKNKENQISACKSTIKDIQSSLEICRENLSISKSEESIDDLFIPSSLIPYLLKWDNKILNFLAECKKSEKDLRLHEMAEIELDRLAIEVGTCVKRIVDFYLSHGSEHETIMLTQLYVLLKAIYKTRFGQTCHPFIIKSLKELLVKYPHFSPRNKSNHELKDFIQNFDNKFSLSDVYPISKFYNTLVTIKDEEHYFTHNNSKASPSEVSVAKLLHENCKAKFKIFSEELSSLLEVLNPGKLFKASLNPFNKILNQLDNYASTKFHPSYEHISDTLSCRAAFQNIQDLKNCYYMISRRYQILKASNDLDNEHTSLTLKIKFMNVIAEVQLVLGSIENDRENEFINSLINTRNIEELYNLIKGLDSYSWISYFDKCKGKVIDERPLMSPLSQKEFVQIAPKESDRIIQMRIIKSMEYGPSQPDFITWNQTIDKVSKLNYLAEYTNSNGFLQIEKLEEAPKKSENPSLKVHRIDGTVEKITVYHSQNDEKQVISGLEIHLASKSIIKLGHTTNGEKNEIKILKNYHLIDFGGKKSAKGAMQSIFCYISTLKPYKNYSNGSWYEGDMKYGKREGFGVFEDGQGNRYEGEWKNNEKCGKGIFLEKGGEVLIGEFEGDEPRRNVIRMLRDGSIHQEEFFGLGESNGFNIFAGHDYYKEFNDSIGFEYSKQTLRFGVFSHEKLESGIQNFVKNPLEVEVILRSGEKFIGEKLLNQIIGSNGTCEYYDGSKYTGEFKDSLRHGHGVYFNSETLESYEGSWQDDKMHGVGTITFRGGETLYGEWNNGKMIKGDLYYEENGYEKIQTCKYNFDGTLIEGIGSYFCPQFYYFGGFKKGNFEHKGKIYYKNGFILEGTWHNGELNGPGKLLTIDGKVFEGDYKDDILVSGTGIVKRGEKNDEFFIGERDSENTTTFMQCSGKEIFEGLVDDYLGRMGKCILRSSNGDIFEGKWRNDQARGPGKLTLANKEFIEGTWQDGILQGKATYHTLNGERLIGKYEKGKLVSGQSVVFLNKKGEASLQKNGTFIDYSDQNFRTELTTTEDGIQKRKIHMHDGSVCETDSTKPGCAKIIYKNGLLYEGGWYWQKGRDGKGKMTDLVGNIYDCTYEADRLKNGTSVFFDEHGFIHIGHVKNFDKIGEFNWITPKNEIFKCIFEDNKIVEGFGVNLYDHRYLYIGEFLDKKRHGKAVVIVQDEFKTILEGIWEYDHPKSGKAFLRDQFGNNYEGEFVNGMKCGNGKLFYQNGLVFEGMWKNDRKDGNGRLILRDGIEIESYYEKGTLIKDICLKAKNGRMHKWNTLQEIGYLSKSGNFW